MLQQHKHALTRCKNGEKEVVQLLIEPCRVNLLRRVYALVMNVAINLAKVVCMCMCVVVGGRD